MFSLFGKSSRGSNLDFSQTCFCQTYRMSHFGKLPDVVLPKIALKRKKKHLDSQDLAILVKSPSGSAKIRNFLFVWLSNFWQNNSGSSPKPPEVGDFGTTRCGFSQTSPTLDYLTGFLAFLSNF